MALLSGAIGPNATQACTYDFPYTDPMSFVSRAYTSLTAVHCVMLIGFTSIVAGIIENVGVSAYVSFP